MIKSGRLRIPQLDLTVVCDTMRNFILRTLDGPTYQGKTTGQFLETYKDVSLLWSLRMSAIVKAQEREGLLMWEHAIHKATPQNPFLAQMQTLLKREDDFNIECEGCGLTVGLSFCLRCKRVRYCGRECQKSDWKTHKPSCF